MAVLVLTDAPTSRLLTCPPAPPHTPQQELLRHTQGEPPSELLRVLFFFPLLHNQDVTLALTAEAPEAPESTAEEQAPPLEPAPGHALLSVCFQKNGGVLFLSALIPCADSS